MQQNKTVTPLRNIMEVRCDTFVFVKHRAVILQKGVKYTAPTPGATSLFLIVFADYFLLFPARDGQAGN
ncbi:MAG: hypothetical protein BMS9Abin06_0479 [Gammaproteobacteria bacterium]|nr:MAG: hypothetical protein BMS9Abin06_0479 [Gammaproteobacteria bacterium]